MQAGHHEAIRCGARCDLCPLANEWGAGPVLGEHPQGAQVLVIDQEPTRTDVKSGRPFAGVDGSTLDAALESAGWSPTDVAREYVVACVPPGGDIRAYEQKLATKNKRAVKAGEQPTPLPTACCEGRLKNAVARYAKVIPMGTVASAATIPGWRGGIDKGRGTLRQAPERKFLPTHRPFRVMKDREWLPAWYGDFQRARRWFDGVELYAPATVFYRPTVEQLEHLLFGPYAYGWRGQRVHVYDVETDGLKATEANLRCIGIGTPSWAVVVPWQPVAWRKQRLDGVPFSTSYTSDGGPIDLYSAEEFKQIAAIIARWATDPTILKAGHNSGVYDRLHMESWFGVTPAPILDNILLHRNAAPDLPHDLGTVASIYNDVRDWKGEHTAVHARTDVELWTYNAEDVVNTARALEPVFAEVERRGQVHMLRIDHVSQSACVGMHRNGMLIDEEERLRRDVELKAKIKLWSTRATDALARSGVDLSAVVKRSKKADEHNEAIRRELLRRGEAGEDGTGLSTGEREDEWALPSPDQLGLDVLAFNPLSHPQLRAVLWDLWDLPIPTDLKEKDLYTSSGEVSTGDALLRRLLSEDRLDPVQREFIFAVRMMRRWSKLWGTYIQPMRPWTGDPKRDAGCRVWADGRVHANWNAHCYDDQTEILTDRGWVKFSDLRETDKTAEWHPDGRIQFVKPLAYYSDFVDGDLVKLRNKDCDLLVTPHHRMAIVRDDGVFREVMAENMPMPEGHRRSSRWRTIHAGQSAMGPGVDISDADLRVLVMLQADGCLIPQRGTRFSFRKGRKIERCRRLLVEAGIPFTEALPTERRREHHFYVAKGLMPSRILALLGENKTFGPWVLHLSRAQADIVLDEMWEWDALAAKKTAYTTTKRENADWLQALLVLSGVRTNLAELACSDTAQARGHAVRFQLGVKRSAYNYITDGVEYGTQPYRGMVYCVEVPSSWVVVRRNGKVTISGNTPITGRFASNGPNVQNWEGSIKAMVVAGSGHLLLGADADQLELRIAASLWGAAMYLEAFERGLDPHQMTMQAVFGRDRMMAFQGAPSSFGAKDFKKKSQFENMRKLAKAIQYASQYGATTETVFRLVTAAEDKETGAMVFANLTLAEVAVMHENWKAGCPEFVKGWDRELAEVRAQGYLLEPVSGRRRDYHDGGRNLSEVVNFKVQAGAASIMNKALEEIVAAFPFGCFGPNTGLINQCHDALTLEVPVWEAKNAADVLQQVMTRTESCFPGVTFTTEAAIAPLTAWDAAKGKHVEAEGGRSRWHMT